MNFKKPKSEVIYEAKNVAGGILYDAFTNIKYNHMNNSPGSTLDQLQNAIEQAIGEAIRSLVENTYTDNEFEEDIGLNT